MFGLSSRLGETFPVLRIEGNKVWARPPSAKDWAEWVHLREASRDFLTPWEPRWTHNSLSHNAFRNRLRRYQRDWHSDQGYALFLFRRDDDALCGGITLTNVRRGIVQSGSFGYWVGQNFAQQGLMTDGLAHIVAFSFDRLGLHRLEAACLPHNNASRRLLQRVGFTHEGRARNYLCIDGKWQDHLLFAMLKQDRRLCNTSLRVIQNLKSKKANMSRWNGLTS